MPREKELGLAPNEVIRYTEDDIQEAVRGDQYDCVLSCAIARRYPAARRIRVNEQQIAFSIGEERFVYPTQEEVIEAVIKPFDEKGPAELKPGVVRLTGGIVKPVQHITDNDRIKEVRARVRVLKNRGGAGQHTSSSRDFGRFGRKDATNG